MSARTSLSRRSFLAATAALPFAASLRAAFAKEVPVGLELYSVRDELTKDLNATVTAVAKIGYQIVEFYSPYFDWTPEKAKEVRKLLDDLGIQCRSTHNGTQSFTDEGLKKAVELNQIIGSKYIVMASAGRVEGIDGWKSVAQKLTSASERLVPMGMAAGYHNHQAEWKPVDGQRPLDVIAANTPKDVVLQLDVGTCVEVGADPVAWINKNPGRIKSMHCKEWSAAKGYAVAFGEGQVPWKNIFAAAESTGGIEYYLIEQEDAGSQGQLAMAQHCLANWKRMRS